MRAQAATCQIDVDRFGVWGSSAGGHLAALVGSSGNDPALEGTVGTHIEQSSMVQAAVDYYGPADIVMMMPDVTTPPGSSFDHDAPSSPESRLLGFDQSGEGIGVLRANLADPAAPFPQLAALAADSNPQSWANADDPPFLIVHGSADMTVPYAQSLRLRDTLLALGHAPWFIRVEGGGHGGFPASVQAQAQAFLLDQLGTALLADGFE